MDGSHSKGALIVSLVVLVGGIGIVCLLLFLSVYPPRELVMNPTIGSVLIYGVTSLLAGITLVLRHWFAPKGKR